MANVFVPEPTAGGDTGVWAPKELPQNRKNIGLQQAQLFNDGGTLKLTKGFIGFNNGSNQGTLVIDTVSTISLAGIGNNNWAKIEVSVSGTVPTFASAQTGDTDPAIMPNSFTGAYDTEKGGFYIVATKRCLGVIFKDGSGNLAGIINAGSVLEEWEGTIFDDDNSVFYYKKTLAKELRKFSITTGTSMKTISLEDVSDNPLLEYYITKNDTGVATIKIDPSSGDTVLDLSVILLMNIDDYVHIYSDKTTNWESYHHDLKSFTGMVNTNDYTDRTLGNINLIYDNLIGTYEVGEIVREYSDIPRTVATGVYGIIIEDDGTTAILCNVVGGGTFTNNLYLKGDESGATSDVNGATKNVDTNITHNFGKNIKELHQNLTFSTDGTENNSLNIKDFSRDIASAATRTWGHGTNQVDTNNYTPQSGEAGFMYFDSSGAGIQLDTEDWYYDNLSRWSK